MNTMIEDSSFLWAYHLDGLGGGKNIPDNENTLTPLSAGFTWVHLQCDSPETTKWMKNHSLSSKVIETLSAVETRPRSMALENGLLIVLRGVNTNPGADPVDMVSVRLWLTENFVVTARKRDRKLLSIEDIRSSIDTGLAPKNSGELLAMLSERIADRVSGVVDRIDDDLTDIETNISDANIGNIRNTLSSSRRQSASLRRYLAPQREALDSLLLDRRILDDQVVHALRLQADRMARYVEDLDLSRERALVLQGELQSRIAEEQNQRMYVLSVVAAIFLPLSFLTGIFGMNVAGLPGTQNANAFMYLSVSMAIVGVALFILMRFKKWL